MKNRSRMAAKLTGVLAAGALLFGAVGPAGAASQDVSYALTSGGISLPTSTVPLVIPLPAATGLTGTWDDVTGDFSAAFTSAEFSSTRAITAPVAGDLTQRIQFTAPNPVTGNIDPATGLGTLAANFTVTIVVESLALPPPAAPITIDVICPMTNVAVTYDVVATGLGGGSVIPTDLALTAQAFTVPVPTCVLGPNGNAALLASVQSGLVTALALPNTGGTSVLQMVAGAIPPPPSTTTTTIVTPTTAAPTTTAAPAARPATPVAAAARFTG